MRRAGNILFSWLPPAAAITLLSLVIYAAVQQNYRQSLNDPQIQIAEDAARALEAGTPVARIVPVGEVESVDIAASLAPWIALYDASGTPLLSSGEFANAMPRLPQGVFDTTAWSAPIIGHHLNTQPPGEDRFTWQPQPDVRQAVVLVHLNAPDGVRYVAAGRNMREAEERESALGWTVLLGWLAALGASLFFKAVEWYFLGKMKA